MSRNRAIARRSAAAVASVLAGLTLTTASAPASPATGFAGAGSSASATGAPPPPMAGASMVGTPSPSQPVDLVLPLAANYAGLQRLAISVATPGSPDFGRYLPIAQLAARFGATRSARSAVVAYLRGAGAARVRVDATGLFVDATMSAALAERVFSTPLARFRSARGARFTAPTGPVRVPGPLRRLVTGVVGLDTSPLAGPRSLNAERAATASPDASAHSAAQPPSAVPRTGTPSGCPQGQTAGEVQGNRATAGFTPNQYLTAYGFGPLRAARLSGQGVRVALIEIDGFKYSDLRTFASCFGLRIPALNVFGVGVHHLLPPGGEATLDLEVLDAAAPGLRAVDVYETGANAAGTLKALTAPLQNRGFRPQLISASLGLCERSVRSAVGLGGIRAAEGALAMAAASGITFLASSGDQGSAECVRPDGSIVHQLAVSYPASSPWATGVGGTNLVLRPDNAIANEVVWNDTYLQPGSAGGGGFSRLFRRPGYQKGPVRSRTRAVPDVAMLADVVPGYAVYCSVQGDCVNPGNSSPWEAVGGTSAATPLLAGGLAAVDQQLRAHRRKSLGFLNPLLYSIGRSRAAHGALHDVTAYGNDVGPYIPGDGRPLGCCSARAGYDAASGFGSVDLAAFASFAMGAEPPIVRVSLPGHQRPVAAHHILAVLSCSGPCRLAALARVKIGGSRPFTVRSRSFLIRRAGRRKVQMRFSQRQLQRLSAALAGHQRIVSTVYGLVVGRRGTIVEQSAGKTLRIRG